MHVLICLSSSLSVCVCKQVITQKSSSIVYIGNSLAAILLSPLARQVQQEAVMIASLIQ